MRTIVSRKADNGGWKKVSLSGEGAIGYVKKIRNHWAGKTSSGDVQTGFPLQKDAVQWVVDQHAPKAPEAEPEVEAVSDPEPVAPPEPEPEVEAVSDPEPEPEDLSDVDLEWVEVREGGKLIGHKASTGRTWRARSPKGFEYINFEDEGQALGKLRALAGLK